MIVYTSCGMTDGVDVELCGFGITNTTKAYIMGEKIVKNVYKRCIDIEKTIWYYEKKRKYTKSTQKIAIIMW